MSFPEEFLEQFKAALERAEEFRDLLLRVSKYDAPDFVPQTREWEVNEETFDRFFDVVQFLRLGVFGQCEGSSLVYVTAVDRTRDQAEIPDIVVPKTDRGATVEQIVEALDAARLNASSANALVERLERSLTARLKKQFEWDRRHKKADGCIFCNGKGWRRDETAFKALDQMARNRARTTLGGYNRVFCSCQEESDGEEA